MHALPPMKTTHGKTLQVLPAAASTAWPLHDAASTKTLERAHRDQPLMARAGIALARLGRALAPHAGRTLILIGPGNNGGDGLAAARWLHSQQHPVHARLVGDPAQLPADAAQALRLAASAGVDIQHFDAGECLPLDTHDLVIDALLGLGSRRAPEGNLAAAVAYQQRLPALTLSVDLPSGLHPDTGALLGQQAVRAHATLALLTIKPGCWTAQGRDHAGEVWWNDLGMASALPLPTAWLPGRIARPWRSHASHKGRFGDVWVFGGAAGMEGALALASAAALAAGAGRVYACPAAQTSSACLAPHPELMQRDRAEGLRTGVLSQATVLAGCGGGNAMADSLPRLLQHAARLVLDADALNAIAAQPDLQPALALRAHLGLPTVLTPHPLEAARLLGWRTEAVQADRPAAARALATRFQVVVVLKGSGTVICSPDQTPAINPTGNAALATAGTGDVLAGWLAGLWAQETSADPVSAALQAVWWHGLAANRHGGTGPLRASDLIEAMTLVDAGAASP